MAAGIASARSSETNRAGNEVGLDPVLPQSGRRFGADGADAHPRGHHAPRLAQQLEEAFHAIGTGEEAPVVLVDAGEPAHVHPEGLDFDHRTGAHGGAEVFQHPGQPARLRVGARDHHANARQRAIRRQVQEAGGALGVQRRDDLRDDGVVVPSARVRAHHAVAVFGQHDSREDQHPVLDHPVGTDGGQAAATQAAKHGALRHDGSPRRRVVNLRRESGGLRAFARLKSQGTLAGGWQHDVEGQEFVDLVEPPQARHAGGGQHQRVDSPLREPAKPGVDVAPDRDGSEVRPSGQQLGRAPRAPRADPGAAPQRLQRPAVMGDQRVAGIRAREKGGQRQPGRGRRREVLGGVHRQLSPPIE